MTDFLGQYWKHNTKKKKKIVQGNYGLKSFKVCITSRKFVPGWLGNL